MDTATIMQICFWLQAYRNILTQFPMYEFLVGEIKKIDSTIEYLKKWSAEDNESWGHDHDADTIPF